MSAPKESGGASAARVRVGGARRRDAIADDDAERADRPLPAGARVYRTDNLTSPRSTHDRRLSRSTSSGHDVQPPANGDWKTNADGHGRGSLAAGRIAFAANTLRYVRYLDDFPCSRSTNVWTDTARAASRTTRSTSSRRTSKVIERCLLMTTDPGDLVLDPTCGSGTTAYVAEQWGRRWITIDTSRVALALARTRLMAAKYPYYLHRRHARGPAQGGRAHRPDPPIGSTDGRHPQGLRVRAGART